MTATDFLNLKSIRGEVVSVESDIDDGTNDSFHEIGCTLCFSCRGEWEEELVQPG